MAVAAPSPWQIAFDRTPSNNLSLSLYQIPEDSSYTDRSTSLFQWSSEAPTEGDARVRHGAKTFDTSPATTALPSQSHQSVNQLTHLHESLPALIPATVKPTPNTATPQPTSDDQLPSLADYFAMSEMERELKFSPRAKIQEERVSNPTVKRGVMRGTSPLAIQDVSTRGGLARGMSAPAALGMSTRGGLSRGTSAEDLAKFFRFTPKGIVRGTSF